MKRLETQETGRISRKVIVVSVASVVVGLGGFSPASAVEKQGAPAQQLDAGGVMVHSEQMKRLLQSERSDAGDRTFDALYAVDRSQIDVGARIRRFRAALVHSPSDATRSALADYERIAGELARIESALSAFQSSMGACVALCVDAEQAAGGNKPIPGGHVEKMKELTEKSAEALADFRDSVGRLALAADGVNDPRLSSLADDLGKEAAALARVVESCRESLSAMTPREGE